MKINHWIKILLTICLGVFALSIVQIYNGFPLLLGDSLGYLVRSIDKIESSHWSNTYSVFILGIYNTFGSLQFITVIQNVIVATTLYIFLKNTLLKFSAKKYILFVVALLFTTLPWISVLLMTDIFTSISFLSIFLILEKPLNKFEKLNLVLFLFIGASVHQSHLMTLPIFVMSLFIIKLYFGSKKQKIASTKNLLLLIIIFIASNIFQKNIINVIKEKDTKEEEKIISTLQKSDIYSGYYFMAVRMYESGQLNHLLMDYCTPGNSNYLCDSAITPENTIRVKNATHHQRNENNKEYLKYSKDNKDFILFCLTKPRFYFGCFSLAIEKGTKLFTNTKIGTFKINLSYKTKIRKFLKSFSKEELLSFKKSKQRKGLKKSTLLSAYNLAAVIWWWILFPFSLLTLAFQLFKMKAQLLKHKAIILCSLALIYGHFLNTMVCGTFSNYKNLRYSVKTLWLVNLALILLICVIITVWKDHKNKTEI